MAWTLPTALFFSAIGLSLVTLTVLELVRPTVARRGLLPLSTTRGDRFFISLLAAAFVHVGFLGFSDGPVAIAGAISIVLAVVLMRWG
jgi:predicted small integral membrane protein